MADQEAKDPMEAFQQILSDPEMQQRVMTLAKSLSANAEGDAPIQQNGAPQQHADREEDAIGGAAEAAVPHLMPPGQDAGFSLPGGMRLTQEDLVLLKALRPYLPDERREKLDRVLKIMKLTQLAQDMKGFL